MTDDQQTFCDWFDYCLIVCYHFAGQQFDVLTPKFVTYSLWFTSRYWISAHTLYCWPDSVIIDISHMLLWFIIECFSFLVWNPTYCLVSFAGFSISISIVLIHIRGEANIRRGWWMLRGELLGVRRVEG